jgi:arylsulfatase A-like enzyme
MPHMKEARMKRILQLLILCLMISGIGAVAHAADLRPNVLFIVSDDLNCFLGCYGDPIVKTPHIDRLAARGVRFERAYCTFPRCGPSRNSFLTGLHPNSTGIHDNEQIFRQTIPTQLSMPQAFRLAGYFAARIGKMYHSNVPTSVGTNGHDDPGSWELEINPAGCDRLEEEPAIFSREPGKFGGNLSWYASPKGDRAHTDGIMADDAAWVLERCARDRARPFFLAVGFYRPHTPFVAPKTPYFEMYPEDEMPLVTGVAEDQQDIPKAAFGSRKAVYDRMTDAQRRQARRAYCASISFLDAQVGRVLDALDTHGLADDTIVVFTSDHGYHMGEHGLYHKMSLFEESARVPLVIAAPGRCQAGSVAKAPVSQVDIFPTLAALCGVEPPKNLQGQSLVPLLADPAAAGRNWAVTQVVRGGNLAGVSKPKEEGAQGKQFFGYSLRTPRWRYTEWDAGREGRELYDHDVDPKELTNLADVPAHAATVAELSKQLAAAVQTTLPVDGVVPEVKPGLWNPNLTNP